MRDHGIINPGMLAALEDNFYPETATIYTVTETQNAVGELVPSLGPVVGTYTDLPCRFVPAVLQAGVGAGGEQRMKDQTRFIDLMTVSFNDYYPLITEEMVVVIDTVQYNIMLVDKDGQDQTSRLRVERVT